MDRYCVGPAMAIDWGDEMESRTVDPELARRVLRYFRPYWRAGAVALGCIVAGALLGLVPALVFRALIDYLGGAHPHFGHLALLVSAGIGAALAGGLIRLLVLDRGHLVDRGMHAELLERGGLYAELYERQFRDAGSRPAPAPLEPAAG